MADDAAGDGVAGDGAADENAGADGKAGVLEETLDSNPLYNEPFPLSSTYSVPFTHQLNTEASSLVTGENGATATAATAEGGADTVIYDQIGPNVKRVAPAADEDGMFLSANVAYGTLGKEAIDNPLYGKSSSREPSTSSTIYSVVPSASSAPSTSSATSTSSAPLTCSVPRSTQMPVLKEVNGYAILSDARDDDTTVLKEVNGYAILSDARDDTASSSSSTSLTLLPAPRGNSAQEVQYELEEVPSTALNNSAVPAPTCLEDTPPGHYAVPTSSLAGTTIPTAATAETPDPTSPSYHYVKPRGAVAGAQRYNTGYEPLKTDQL